MYKKKLMKYTVTKLAVVNGEMRIGKNKDEILGLDYTYWKENLYVDIVDHRITTQYVEVVPI